MDYLKNKLKSLIFWFRYTFTYKHNVVNISTLPNGWHDSDTKLLHSNFQILVDFVEIEKAHMERLSEDILPKQAFKRLIYSLFKKYYRSRELGIKYLDWEQTIPETGTEGCPGQAAAAKELKDLYIWWKDIYPNRPDTDEVTGLHDFYNKNRHKLLKFRPCVDHPGLYESYNTLTKEEEAIYHELLSKTWGMDEKYDQEEDDMLLRLIKIRRSLWT